jgi:two-component system sensor histidine kinase KdpD
MEGRTRARDDLPRVLIDAEKIERMLANLLDNVLKYTPDDQPIVLSAETADHQLVVSVADCGPRIPPAERERIFERFARWRAQGVTGGVLAWG